MRGDIHSRRNVPCPVCGSTIKRATRVKTKSGSSADVYFCPACSHRFSLKFEFKAIQLAYLISFLILLQFGNALSKVGPLGPLFFWSALSVICLLWLWKILHPKYMVQVAPDI
jgi:hypothetical protein